MIKEKTLGVFIGRFQPIHNGHYEVLKKAINDYEQVLVLVGSSEAPVSLRNPFDFQTRVNMISSGSILDKNPFVAGVPDSAYDFNKWLHNVQSIIDSHCRKIGLEKAAIIGYYKDAGSFWLNHFPQYEFDNIQGRYQLNATDVRRLYFSGDNKWKELVPPMAAAVMEEWTFTKDYSKLANEQKFVDNYKAKWADAPFPPIFVTVDSLVICRGHVLVIKRGRNPHKDMYALPGGFVNQHETLRDSAIRELKEETQISVARPILENCVKQVKVFDAINRDDRGRAISHTHVFDLNVKNWPTVKAADDANDAMWMSFNDVDKYKREFAFDHYQIIKNLI